MGWGSSVAVSSGAGCRWSSDPELLWLWHRPTATAPIGPLTWTSICFGSGPRKGKMTKTNKQKKKTKKNKLYYLLLKNYVTILFLKIYCVTYFLIIIFWQYWNSPGNNILPSLFLGENLNINKVTTFHKENIYSFYFFFFCLFRATPAAYRGSQPRGLIRAVAAGLHHSFSNICDLHHSSWQCWILDPLSEARDQTRNLIVPSRICFHCTMTGNPLFLMLCFTVYLILTTFINLFSLLLLLFFGCIHGTWMFLGQGLNLCHSSNLSHSSDNAGSLTCCAKVNSYPFCF